VWSARLFLPFIPILLSVATVVSQVLLRTKIGQMVMVTVTGDSVEESSPSMDTLKTDLAEELLGGVIMFNWSGNLRSPEQIAHLTASLQERSSMPLLLAIDQEGGRVARLKASNGFAATPSAHEMGTVVNQESYTRSTASAMADWFVQTGLNMNLAPVVDLNVNPSSPAIGALDRSFSADPATVTQHAGWFIDEFRKKSIVTTLKHFPGHGSAADDSHLGFTDVTATWSPLELEPYSRLLASGSVDAVMTAHVFNANLDSLYPATLSPATMTGILRTQIGFQGVVVSDEMTMRSIAIQFGIDEAAELAVLAGVDVLLYNRNLDSTGGSLARRIVDLLERRVRGGRITEARINESYARIKALKERYLTSVSLPLADYVPAEFSLGSYPNPFNAMATVTVTLPRTSRVEVEVFDLLGRVVATVAREDLPAGSHEFRWDAHEVSSGMYLCRFTADHGGRVTVVRTIKMMLVR
jgi:beta-N-acetylhexosaminidase